jgi:hypothetical protein
MYVDPGMVMTRTSFEPPLRIPPSFDPRTSGGHGLARLRAERTLCTRYSDEYERLEVRLGHVGAVAKLVRRHTKEYGRLVSASAADAPEQLGFARRRLSA